MKIMIVILFGLILIATPVMAAETTEVTDGDGNLVVTVTLSPDEQSYLNNDLLSISDWIQRAIVGKINKCKSRFQKEWDQKLRADPSVTAIPTDDTEFLNTVKARPDYKDRKKREALVK